MKSIGDILKLIPLLDHYPTWAQVVMIICLVIFSSIAYFARRDMVASKNNKDASGQTASYTFNLADSKGNIFHINTTQSKTPEEDNIEAPSIGFRESDGDKDNLFELEFDGIDDYCEAVCPQLETMAAFRMETSILLHAERYSRTAQAVVQIHNTKASSFFALVLSPYEKDRTHSQLHVLYQNSSSSQSYLGPLLAHERYTDVSVEISNAYLRIRAGSESISYPFPQSLKKMVHCKLGAMQKEERIIGRLDGNIQYFYLRDLSMDEDLIDWRFSGTGEPHEVAWRDHSKYASDLRPKPTFANCPTFVTRKQVKEND